MKNSQKVIKLLEQAGMNSSQCQVVANKFFEKDNRWDDSCGWILAIPNGIEALASVDPKIISVLRVMTNAALEWAERDDVGESSDCAPDSLPLHPGNSGFPQEFLKRLDKTPSFTFSDLNDRLTS